MITTTVKSNSCVQSIFAQRWETNPTKAEWSSSTALVFVLTRTIYLHAFVTDVLFCWSRKSETKADPSALALDIWSYDVYPCYQEVPRNIFSESHVFLELAFDHGLTTLSWAFARSCASNNDRNTMWSPCFSLGCYQIVLMTDTSR